jgi:hypothetical protein
MRKQYMCLWVANKLTFFALYSYPIEMDSESHQLVKYGKSYHFVIWVLQDTVSALTVTKLTI